MALYGRDTEQAAIDGVLASARRGAGASLTLWGEAGSGKSTLLLEATERAGDTMTVVRTSGVESEAPLAFAALQRLLRPLMKHLDAVAAPQAHAVRVAFGEEAGDAGDRFLVFMGALSLLAASAETRPVLAVVDDAQWLDEASAAALHFIARRIPAEPIALLWGARAVHAGDVGATDLPALRVRGLGLDGVRAILAEETGSAVAPEVAAVLLTSTGGNPLAVREVPSVLSEGQLTGEEPLPPRMPVTERVEAVFLDRARRLSASAQLLLLVAAADDSARLVTVLRAVEALGADAQALDEVERSGLVSVSDDLVTLRHPLVRSALYSAAPSAERRRVHGALALVLSEPAEVDRRAWHRAASVVEPDETVVRDLVEAARRAEARGGHEAAAAAWSRAAELSAHAAPTSRHLFSAAMASWVAGHPDRARQLVDQALSVAEDPGLSAVARRLRARIEWNTGSVQLAHRMLMTAATDVAPHDQVLARELATEAVSIAVWCADPGPQAAMSTLVPSPGADASARERTYHAMLRGLERVVAGDFSTAEKELRSAFDAYEGLPEDYDLLPGLSVGAMHLGDFALAEVYLRRLLNHARQEGVAVMVLYAITRLTFIDLAAGRWSDAVAGASEAVSLGEMTGHQVLADTPVAVLMVLAALRGDDDSFAESIPRLETALSKGAAGVLGVVLRDVAQWAHGIRPSTAPASAFHHLGQMSHDLTRRMASLERIEAAVRADQVETARMWVEDTASFAAGTSQSWAAAVAEHGRALLAGGEVAETHFERALQLHADAAEAGAARPFERARTQLAFGEFLRRARRRVDARPHLRAALDTFQDLRAQPWADRAGAELRASGETVAKRGDSVEVTLTPQERQVAQLVRRGMSNKDVAGHLFVSPRTVDFHLRNVFAKTGVTSRAELVGLALD